MEGQSHLSFVLIACWTQFVLNVRNGQKKWFDTLKLKPNISI